MNYRVRLTVERYCGEDEVSFYTVADPEAEAEHIADEMLVTGGIDAQLECDCPKHGWTPCYGKYCADCIDALAQTIREEGPDCGDCPYVEQEVACDCLSCPLGF